MSPAAQAHRLRKHPDFQRAYQTAGRRQWAREIAFFSALREPGSLQAQRSQTEGPRIGLTVPKALGPAVVRNRIKRRLRAATRAALPLLGTLPVDIILHPKRTVLQAEFHVLERDVAQIFRTVRSRAQQPSQPAGSAATKTHPGTGDCAR